MNCDFVDRFKEAHLLVAGEVGIDEYIWGEARRISPEAPVPVVEVDKVEEKLGLAANVANNIASLGGKVTLVSVRGADDDGARLANMLEQEKLSHIKLLLDPSRPTMRKVRVVAQKQQLVRIDYEKCHSLSAVIAKEYNDAICDFLPGCDGMIVQDYGKGLWHSDTMAFIKHAQALKKPVFVDPNRTAPASLYQGSTLLTPNTAEAEILSGLTLNSSRRLPGKDDEYLIKIGKSILQKTGSPYIVITCGEWGMVSLSSSGEFTRIPTFARDVFDVTGAGDTVVAVLSLMWVLGYSLSNCMQVANTAAGVVVGRIGTATVTQNELRCELERLESCGYISS